VVEGDARSVKCRTLFATHYHELTRPRGTARCLSLHHVRAREWKGDLVLLARSRGRCGRPKLRNCGRASSLGCRERSWRAPNPCSRKLEAGRDATGWDCRWTRRLAACSPRRLEPEHSAIPLAPRSESYDPRQPEPAPGARSVVRLETSGSEHGK
jgi:DNA mismatch repair protein MutS